MKNNIEILCTLGPSSLNKNFLKFANNKVDLLRINLSHIEIKDLKGDSNHYAATIKSKLFNNLSKIDQHKMVYKSLKGKMGNELHALSITTESK